MLLKPKASIKNKVGLDGSPAGIAATTALAGAAAKAIGNDSGPTCACGAGTGLGDSGGGGGAARTWTGTIRGVSCLVSVAIVAVCSSSLTPGGAQDVSAPGASCAAGDAVSAGGGAGADRRSDALGAGDGAATDDDGIGSGRGAGADCPEDILIS